jgi:pimeloyl-ACP methyl ester carboxylesterase
MPDRPVEPFPDVTPAGFADPPPGQGLQRYLDQVIEWVPCAAGSVEGDCADILVPLDYADPDGQAITLAVFKRPPADGVGAMGPLFVNPGGPGTPGRGVAAWLDAASLPGYSLVGWDPRGVGASTPVVCDTDLDALRALDASPDDAAEEEAFVDGWRAFDQSCLAQSGRLLQHVGTADTVADLDLLRALLGADRLNYLGYSYGTAIGALYAQTYPDKVGRMVLDSPVNITDNDSVSQAAGFDVAFGNFADWCVESGCRLATPGMATGADLVTATIAWLDALDQVPVPVGDRFLTQSLASDGLALYLYQDASAYPDLADALGEAEVGDGAALLEAADGLWERNDDGSYSPALGAFTAIRCVDGTDSGLAGAFAEWRKEAAEAPLFGGSAGLDVACEVWPVRASLDDVTITAAGAAPILVVGATGDSATPYEYAQWMEEQMPSARLLTYDGPGHATYGGRNDCVDTTVNTYLNEGTLPPKGTVCAA